MGRPKWMIDREDKPEQARYCHQIGQGREQFSDGLPVCGGDQVKLETHHRPRRPGLLIAAKVLITLPRRRRRRRRCHRPTSRTPLVQEWLDTNLDTLH